MTIIEAARALGTSKQAIYQRLKRAGLTAAELTDGNGVLTENGLETLRSLYPDLASVDHDARSDAPVKSTDNATGEHVDTEAAAQAEQLRHEAEALRERCAALESDNAALTNEKTALNGACEALSARITALSEQVALLNKELDFLHAALTREQETAQRLLPPPSAEAEPRVPIWSRIVSAIRGK